MAYFYSIRGWLEVEPDRFEEILEAVRGVQARNREDPRLSLYAGGWCWSETAVNWTRYLFYGADVTDDGLAFFEQVLAELTGKGIDTSGYFHVQGEDGERNVLIEIADDHVTRRPADPIVEVT